MRSLSLPRSLEALIPDRALFTRRGLALLATILVHLLLVLLMLLSREQPEPVKAERDLVTFSVMPDPAKKTAGARKEKADVASPAESAPRVQPRVTPPPVPDETPPSFIPMTRDAFAATDIASLPRSGAVSGAGGAGNSRLAASGPGEGPGGVRLYEAEWYRRPTEAELAGYLPADMPSSGWGLVACKTVENFHVENCQQLGESPLGSGLGRAVRQAAWQFLVRPPRVDGKAMVGEWVRIRIDYSQRTVAQ
jgi:protein TonB